MSTLTTADIQKMAELSKLALPTEKLPTLTVRLENVLTLVKKMNDANTHNTEPLAHPLNAIQPLRDDIVSEKNQRDLFQQNAPTVEAGLYIVPKFVEAE
ncbi:MAG: Aspartyl/glutamyl-tRNA amidotransferase subunit C [uncultured bacterium]|nr:MAG: Aspartyl/glutamyl-tRNA amidotransferase subunit C [uncultured bacterium]OGT34592.1 MAG: asparaginyl/glutamyl-tRNA amidotransferase subunit C [Gammaproteobacteria bacterium RIFCSPHIGHO2_02_FULL_39_13]OGT50013.1 MAG: asparaginyl/glutamyl-tRNA amidotransferase subunit C [Gammaproteobacteria bacterium RIFCSPHIGHO2_12_FULL_39_24]